MKIGLLLLLLATCACRQESPKHVTETVPQTEATMATITAFTEGPTVDLENNVYFTEVINQRILKMAPGGALTIFREQSNTANGLLFDSQWRLIACEGATIKGNRPLGFSPFAANEMKPRVTRTDLKTGKMEVLAEGFEGKPFVGPNDVTIDNQGRLYFTDLPGGAVYRIDTDGKLSRILNAPDVQRPNGIQISPDDKTLYLVEANQAEGGARMLRAYDLQADGSVTNMRVFHTFSPGRSADGMCMDSGGNVYAAAGLHQRRGTSETLDTRCGVHVFSPQGKLIRFIPIPEDTITNCAFGGSDLKTLYVTAGKGVYQAKVDIAGTRR
jgi:gluconolactonase